MVKLLFVIGPLMFFWSNAFCQKQADTTFHSKSEAEKIMKFNYTRMNGEAGYFLSFTVSKDSINFRKIVKNKPEKIINRRNDSTSWRELLNTITPENFREIRSGRNKGYKDGTDEDFSMTTTKGFYNFQNGDTTKIPAFVNVFFQQMSRTQGNEQEKIIKVIYDFGGGKSGYGLGFSVSKDSMALVVDTIYSQQLHRYLNNGHRTRATNPEEWNKLVNAIDLKSFDQIKSGRNMRQIDGTDLHVTIVTTLKLHYIIVDRTNSSQLKEFMDELSSEIASFKQTAVRQKDQ